MGFCALPAVVALLRRGFPGHWDASASFANAPLLCWPSVALRCLALVCVSPAAVSRGRAFEECGPGRLFLAIELILIGFRKCDLIDHLNETDRTTARWCCRASLGWRRLAATLPSRTRSAPARWRCRWVPVRLSACRLVGNRCAHVGLCAAALPIYIHVMRCFSHSSMVLRSRTGIAPAGDWIRDYSGA